MAKRWIFLPCTLVLFAFEVRADRTDAERAFAQNPVKASKEIVSFGLTDADKVRFGRNVAINQGNAFSELIRFYELKDEVDRFDLGIIATTTNTWSNVRFDIDAFEIHDRTRLLALIKATIDNSDYQIKFLKDWGLTRDERLDVLRFVAGLYGIKVAKHWHIIPDISEEEIRDLLLEGAEKADKDSAYQGISSGFDAAWLPTEAHRTAVAKALAKKDSNFIRSLPRFEITATVDYDHIVRLNLTVPMTAALRHPKLLRLTDAQLFEAYINLRDRDSNGQLTDGYSDVRFANFHDPIALIETTGGFKFPTVIRPGLEDKATEPEAFNPFASEGAEASMFEATEFAEERSDLLPTRWIDIAYQSFRNPTIATELLRQCYRLSTKARRFEPRDSLHIALEAAGLKSDRWKAQDFRPNELQNLHVELLSLMHHMPQPIFRGIPVEEDLYGPQHAQAFSKFLRTLRERIHWDSSWNKNYEWVDWLRLRDALELTKSGITVVALDSLGKWLQQRPHSSQKPRVAPSCKGAFGKDEPQ